MQKLVTVQFDEDEDPNTMMKRRVCPSCRKVLTNASSPVLAKQCGHVVCHNCIEKFLLPTAGKKKDEDAETPLACYVCDTPLPPAPEGKSPVKGALPVGLVMLRSEGTGFSARGTNAVKKSGVAFQC
jgi:nitric oxide synthase-interacting protein